MARMSMRFFGIVSLVGVGAVAAFGQGFSGKGQYPQYRGASGLPGGFFSLNYEGTPTMKGAMAMTTPIGYSLSNYHFAGGFSNMSYDSKFRFPRVNEDGEYANGTGIAMMGFSTKFGNFTVADMIHSNLGDNVINLLWQAPVKKQGLGLALGVQDLLERGGSAGVNQDGDHDNRRTVFGVATYEIQPGTYVSLGVGDHRFKGVFGNASHNITPRLKVFGEYDTYNWNYGVAYDMGFFGPQPTNYNTLEDKETRRGNIFMTLGFVRQNRLNWGVTLTY